MDERVSVNGTTLRARVEGKPGAPWVVLVHSLGTGLDLWDPQVAAFGVDYRILRYDMRGHGGSDAPAGSYTMRNLADDLLDLLRHFAIARAHVVGISLGALTALEVAIRQPPEISSIAVCDSRADMPPEFAKAIDDRNRLIREKGMAAIADAMPERWLTPATLQNRPAIADKIRKMVLAASVEGFVGCSEAIKSAGLMDRIGAIRLPSLFVAADQDSGLPIEVMRAMQAKVPGSGFAVIPAASHLSNLEQPEVFNAILLQYLRRVG
ncbi:MAG: alpha/beta fold hydrolase [Propylenella sp.]